MPHESSITMQHPAVQRVLGSGYLSDAGQVDAEMLCGRRSELEMIEGQVSFVRRLAQGRIDILCAELERRDLGGDRGDLGELLRRLPEVFGGRSVLSTREVVEIEPDESFCEGLDALAGTDLFIFLPEHENDEIDAVVVQLEKFEAELSVSRRQLHERIEQIQIEIARRYQPSSSA
jgi:hypothetical protein